MEAASALGSEGMMKPPIADPIRPPTPSEQGYRRVAEPLVLDLLAVSAWAVELDAGRRSEAIGGAARWLEAAVSAGLGFRSDAANARFFDPVEVDQFLGWLATVGPDRDWLDRLYATNAAVVAENRSAAAAAPSDAPAGSARYRVGLRRTFDLARFEPGAQVRLRLPLPLHCEFHPDFSIAVTPPTAGDADISVTEGRLEARLRVTEDPLVTIGVDIDLTARLPVERSDAGGLDPRLAEAHLRQVEGLIRVTPRIEALADQLGGGLDPLGAVTAFWVYLQGAVRFQFVGYESVPLEAPGDWVLDNGFSDCLLCSALLVSLCRARGIPARLVNGFSLFRLCPSGHSWAEIWIDGRGWLPLDVLHRERHEPLEVQGMDWWTHVARRQEYRMVTERLPLAFTGPMSVRMPPAWRMLHGPAEGGLTTTYIDLSDGSLIYHDQTTALRIG